MSGHILAGTRSRDVVCDTKWVRRKKIPGRFPIRKLMAGQGYRNRRGDHERSCGKVLTFGLKQAAELIGRQTGVIDEQSTHLSQDVVFEIIACPSFGYESLADLFQSMVAEFVGLTRNRSLMDTKQLSYFSLTHFVPPPQTENESFALTHTTEPITRGEAERLVPTGVGLASRW